MLATRDGGHQQEIVKLDFKSRALEPTMASAHHSRPSGLRAALAWFQASLTGPAGLSGLSNRDLGDIGVRLGSLSSAIDRDVARRSLVDFGWRLGH